MRTSRLLLCALVVAAARPAHAETWKDLHVAADVFGKDRSPGTSTDDGTTAWTIACGDDCAVFSTVDGATWTRVADAPLGNDLIVRTGKALVISQPTNLHTLWRVDGDKAVQIAGPWADLDAVDLVSDGKAFFTATEDQVYTSVDGVAWKPYGPRVKGQPAITGLATGAYGVVALLDYGRATLRFKGGRWTKLRDDNLVCAPSTAAWISVDGYAEGPSGEWSTDGGKTTHRWSLPIAPTRCRLDGKTLVAEGDGVYRAEHDTLAPVAVVPAGGTLVEVVHLGKRTLGIGYDDKGARVFELVP